jgi:hypothetical protein
MQQHDAVLIEQAGTFAKEGVVKADLPLTKAGLKNGKP